ncbi:uncharacterized protein LOC110177962 [Drosophila serrata]|uniref:uncharacterized protein LOC110177962 n=1 Tax=Drosophila serrata TaxID=7274 RepID=UPI000A1D096F|nr:uncharacterized protein LOC110177962 [Drosophila serrata]
MMKIQRQLLYKWRPRFLLHHAFARLGSTSSSGSHRTRGARQPSPTPAPSPSNRNLDIELDVVVSKDEPHQISLPSMVFFYSPLTRLVTKLSILQLKLLWDWDFSESNFLENSCQAAVVFTDFVRRRRNRNVERCSTPMGFKQIKHDLLDDPTDWRLDLMRFERNHIRRAIPLKVQLLRHYDHRFAFLDVVYVALRRSNDFRSPTEQRAMAELVDQYVDSTQLLVPHPLIFAEIFMRFRRDYSVTPTKMGNVQDNNRCMGQWLISTYKVVRFDILNNHPLFDIPVFDEWMPPIMPRMGRSTT